MLTPSFRRMRCMATVSHEVIQRLGDRLGFALVGVCAAEPSQYTDLYKQWLAAGKHGEMHYLAENVEKRNDPCQLLPGARSIICVADQYHTRANTDENPNLPNFPEPGNGRIARYAWGDDYHQVIKKRLFEFADALREQHPDHDFKVAVDTAPVLEREHAGRAGLGWVGKHTLLIHPEKGSYLLLGEIITTLDIPRSRDAESEIIAGPHLPGATLPGADYCGTCTRCIDACPTDCITPYQLDAGRCISYLTIEHRGVIDERLQEMMGDWIAGCDICQEVCPFNAKRERNATSVDEPMQDAYEPRADFARGLPLSTLLSWTEDDRRTAFTKSALKRIKLDMLKRNALIAAANTANDETRPAIAELAGTIAADRDASDVLRQTARQVAARLANG